MWPQENVQVSDKTLDSCKWKRKEILEVYLLLKQYSAKTSCVIMTVKKKKKTPARSLLSVPFFTEKTEDYRS